MCVLINPYLPLIYSFLMDISLFLLFKSYVVMKFACVEWEEYIDRKPFARYLL